MDCDLTKNLILILLKIVSLCQGMEKMSEYDIYEVRCKEHATCSIRNFIFRCACFNVKYFIKNSCASDINNNFLSQKL